MKFKILNSQFEVFSNVMIIIFRKKFVYIFKIPKNVKKINKIIDLIKIEFYYLIILEKFKNIYIEILTISIMQKIINNKLIYIK